jgi:hypothetical protein
VPNEPTATPAAPAAPASAPAAPRKQVHLFDPKKAYEGSTAVDRMKQYLKDVPVLHQRLTASVAGLEATLTAAKKAAADLEKVTADIRVTVARWEGEQNHGRPGNGPVAATPAPGLAPADPAAGAPAADPASVAGGSPAGGQ